MMGHSGDLITHGPLLADVVRLDQPSVFGDVLKVELVVSGEVSVVRSSCDIVLTM